MRRLRSTAAGLGGLILAGSILTACGSNNGTPSPAGTASAASCATGSISGAGSTFQLNIEQQWVTDFGNDCRSARVNYQGTGSGAGIQQFNAGTIDFAGSDVPMKPVEQQAADRRCGGAALTIPITAGGVAIEYNLPGVRTVNLSPDTLAGIFQGQLTQWNDPRIAADNPGVRLPATAITPYHRADGSGTTAVLSQFLQANAPGVWKLGSGKTLVWPAAAGQAAKGSDGVTAGVKQTTGGVSYAELSFAKANNLSLARIKNAGQFTALTGPAVSEALATGFRMAPGGGVLDFASMKGYPLSTVSYAIVCKHYPAAATGAMVRAFLTYGVTAGQVAADSLGYAPLPGAVANQAKTALASVS